MKLSRAECEARLIFAIVVAGKSFAFADQVMKRFCALCIEHGCITPFELIQWHMDSGTLSGLLAHIRCGNYSKIHRCFCELVSRQINPKTVRLSQLETIHGIGQKTSRFFLVWRNPELRYAVLDVHVLRWLRAEGYATAQKATPAGAAYLRWEKIFLCKADALGLTPRQLDTQIWEAATQKPAAPVLL